MPSPQGQNSSVPSPSPVPDSFRKIEHIVVLMLENRSFDHLFGFMKSSDPRIEGLTGAESNDEIPGASPPSPVRVSRATAYTMPFDPGHEFEDVQVHLFGPSAPPVHPAPMGGFVVEATKAAGSSLPARRVMECFQPDQIPVLTTLAREFALFDSWHSSLPGPTWPNRFFAHAATSGGLSDSPTDTDILEGYSFSHGTLYARLKEAGKEWRIYHDGLPQTAGINSLRLEYIDPFTQHFRHMEHFADDVRAGDFPPYVFIEPNYDTGHNYLGGNSMHPLNDIRKGEELIAQVYENLRNSSLWDKLMLLIVFDEHGGFFDHVPPPMSAPTGDDAKYAHSQRAFRFDYLGVRVPAILISAYTKRETVVGGSPPGPGDHFDHSSIPATVAKRFGLAPLTQRDASSRTLEIALNLANPRLSPAEVPLSLGVPKADSWWERFLQLFRGKPPAARDDAPISQHQKNFLTLALACDLQVSDPREHPAIKGRHQTIRTQGDATRYIREVERKIHVRRKPR